jgi:hypothetical protein
MQLGWGVAASALRFAAALVPLRDAAREREAEFSKGAHDSLPFAFSLSEDARLVAVLVGVGLDMYPPAYLRRTVRRANENAGRRVDGFAGLFWTLWSVVGVAGLIVV